MTAKGPVDLRKGEKKKKKEEERGKEERRVAYTVFMRHHHYDAWCLARRRWAPADGINTLAPLSYCIGTVVVILVEATENVAFI